MRNTNIKNQISIVAKENGLDSSCVLCTKDRVKSFLVKLTANSYPVLSFYVPVYAPPAVAVNMVNESIEQIHKEAL